MTLTMWLGLTQSVEDLERKRVSSPEEEGIRLQRATGFELEHQLLPGSQPSELTSPTIATKGANALK